MLKQIRNVLVDTLGIDETHGHLILYETPINSREVHQTRDKRFIFVEIQMFAGRSDEKKEKLFKKFLKS